MYLNSLRRYPALVLLASSFGIAAAHAAQPPSAPSVPLTFAGTKCEPGYVGDAPGPQSCTVLGSHADVTVDYTYFGNGFATTSVVRGMLDSTNGIPTVFSTWFTGNYDFVIPGPPRKILAKGMSMTSEVVATVPGTLGTVYYNGLAGRRLITTNLIGDGKGMEWSSSTPFGTSEVMSDQIGAKAYIPPHVSHAVGLFGNISTGQVYATLQIISITQYFEMDGVTPVTITVLKSNGNGPKK